MSNLKAEIGARIAEIRKRNGDTQEKAAQKLGIKRGTLASYELGTSSMPDEIKSKFVTIYNISYDYLILGKDESLALEPSAGYAKKNLLSLLNQLNNNELNNEIRGQVLDLINQNTELKDKVINLMEEREKLIDALKKEPGT